MMNEQIYETAFVRRCATDETYNGELLSARDFDRWLAQVKAEALLRSPLNASARSTRRGYTRTAITDPARIRAIHQHTEGNPA